MVAGFSGFGFPKAHGAAFGLLAYQSTWLRVHYGPEFLCALLDEQPMGFYPPDALVHEAQRRGIAVLAPEVNASEVGCTVTVVGRRPAAVQVGLGYVLGVRADEVAALVAARHAGGPFRSLEDLASRAGAGRAALERLAWSGACDALAGGDRRVALWQLGVTAPGVRVRGREGVQLALALDLPAPPKLQAAVGLGRDGRRLRDDRADGLDASDRAAAPAAARRRRGRHRRARAPAARRARAGRRARHRAPAAGDREGHHVPAARGRARDGQRHRLAADLRARPAHGAHRAARRRRRAPGAPCVGGRGDQHRRARRTRLEVGDRVAAQVKDFSLLDAIELARQSAMQEFAAAATAEPGELAATGTDDFRAVAPPVMNFGAGRSRCRVAGRRRRTSETLADRRATVTLRRSRLPAAWQHSSSCRSSSPSASASSSWRCAAARTACATRSSAGARQRLHVAEFAVAAAIALFGLIVPAVVAARRPGLGRTGREKLSADLKEGRELFDAASARRATRSRTPAPSAASVRTSTCWRRPRD